MSVPDPPDFPTASAAFERACRLDAAVRISVAKATALVNEAQRGRRERQLWRHIRMGLEREDEPVLACCSYCGLVRSGEGDWGAIPVQVVQALYSSATVVLSHGICPDCEASLVPELVSAHCDADSIR